MASYGIQCSGKKKKIQVPLKSIYIHSLIRDGIAKVEVQQSFLNDSQNSLEVEYVFPIDVYSAVYNLKIWSEDVEITAKIEEKKKAGQKYEDTISKGHTAYYAAYDTEDSSDRMVLFIGNLKQQQEVIVNFCYITQLQSENQAWKFIIPSFLTPSYTVSAALKKSSQVNPEELKSDIIDYTIDFEATVQSLRQITKVECLSHDVEIVSNGQNEAQIFIKEGKSYNPDKDFILRYTIENIHQPGYYLQKSQNIENEIAGVISFLPQVLEEEEGTGEFLFLLDRSGSMSGNKIKMAIQAAILFMQSLPTDSRFDIISFGSDFTPLFGKPQVYDDQSLQYTIDKLNAFKADMGGTEILQPLQNLFQTPVNKKYPRSIFLITDGEVDNPQQVINLILKNSHVCRVHSIGIGEGVSKQLIRETAKAGRGKSYFVKSGQNIQEKVIQALTNAVDPAFTDFKLIWDESLNAQQVPVQIPFIYMNEPLLIYCFLREPYSSGKIRLEAQTSSGKTFVYEIYLDLNTSVPGSFLHKLVAKQKIQELEKDVRQNEEQIIKDSLKYQIISSCTAFIGEQQLKTPSQETPVLVKIPIKASKDSVRIQESNSSLQSSEMEEEDEEEEVEDRNESNEEQKHNDFNIPIVKEKKMRCAKLSNIAIQGDSQSITSLHEYDEEYIEGDMMIQQNAALSQQIENSENFTYNSYEQSSQVQSSFNEQKIQEQQIQSKSSQNNLTIDIHNCKIFILVSSDYTQILKLQSAKGFFQYSEELLFALQSLCNQNLSQVKPQELNDNLYVTLLVLEYFEFFFPQKIELVLVIKKVKRWITSQQVDIEKYQKSFAELFKK